MNEAKLLKLFKFNLRLHITLLTCLPHFFEKQATINNYSVILNHLYTVVHKRVNLDFRGQFQK